MLSEHDEIEAKLVADHVSVNDFKKFMAAYSDMEEFRRIVSPDRYYECGPNVVRVRGVDNDHDRPELTVKKRKSEASTRDRLEIDLRFDKDIKIKDVIAYLTATGYVPSFTIEKESHIFWINLTEDVTATFVIYDVWLTGETKKRRFIEVEIEKNCDVTVETAKRHLRAQVKMLQDQFKLAEPLNESLWEIYSGKKYQCL